MVVIFDNIWIGSQDDCTHGSQDRRVIHACKYPCYQDQLDKGRRAIKSDADYLVVQHEHDLYLNIVDARKPLFFFETFWAVKQFCLDTPSSLLIHCNKGESRSVALALLCATWKGIIHPPSWKNALRNQAWYDRVPVNFGAGIDTFLTDNWMYLTQEKDQWDGSQPDSNYFLSSCEESKPSN
jgi:hypothetical protein